MCTFLHLCVIVMVVVSRGRMLDLRQYHSHFPKEIANSSKEGGGGRGMGGEGVGGRGVGGEGWEERGVRCREHIFTLCILYSLRVGGWRG